METSQASEPGGALGTVPNQLAILVPTFDPAKDDLKTFTQKIELLTMAWPENRYGELATRIILNCSGSAFQKLQLCRDEVTKNEKKSVAKIIEILGGSWGQIDLERKYESAEKALYHCVQKQDESNDSYLARADILWTEVLSKGMKLEELQSYVTLRGSGLTPEDKKRVVVESHSSAGSVLTIKRVSEAIRMLGAGFFQDVTGQRRSKTRTYDATAMVTEDDDIYEGASWESAMMTQEDHVADDDDLLETLIADGDGDAAFIAEFEGAANELLQSDGELAGCYTAYLDARKRLAEKAKHRGFWPLSRPKGKGKGVKGKFGKSSFKGNHKKSLAHRIMNSTCRRCGQVGNWRAECPLNQSGSSTAGPSTAATNTAVSWSHAVNDEMPNHDSVPASEADSLPLEFLNLSEVDLKSIDESCPGLAESFFLMGFNQDRQTKKSRSNDESQSIGNRDKLRECYQRVIAEHQRSHNPNRCPSVPLRNRSTEVPIEFTDRHVKQVVCQDEAVMLAASCSHGTKGVLDTGATKTVVGSDHLKELISSFDSDIRSQLKRGTCKITFRFGNQGTLDATSTLIVPLGSLLLQIAVVPGGTPFLVSNSLLRALKCNVDLERCELRSPMLKQAVPLELSSKGLFLIDINHIARHASISPKGVRTYHVDDSTHNTETPSKPVSFDPKSEHGEGQAEPSRDSKLLRPKIVCSLDPDICPAISRRYVNSSSPTSSTTGARCSDPTSTTRDVHGGIGTVGSGFRYDSQRQNVRRGLEERTGLDSMDDGKVLRVKEGISSTSHAVCGEEDSGGGEGTKAHPVDQSWKHCNHGDGENKSERISKDTGQAEASTITEDPHCRERLDRSSGGRRDRGLVGLGGDSTAILRDSSGRVSAADSHAQSGEHASGSREPSESEATTAVIQSECLHCNLTAGDIDSDETDSPCFSVTGIHQEREKLRKLVQQITYELEEVSKRCNPKVSSRVDLLEVFCNEESQLTLQCQKLGGKAQRFCRSKGDLDTREGRQKLFQEVCWNQPRNIWFAPSCHPWCAWSQLNGSRSEAAWQELVSLRTHHLVQIALGIVLHRWQRHRKCHMHWEQPHRSLMFKLPYFQEIFAYSHIADFDMCIVGDLKDPETSKPMKKPMMVATTSQKLFQGLNSRKCPGVHEHQTIEGSVNIKGHRVNRSQYTENYPRKFARSVMQILLKYRGLGDSPKLLIGKTDSEVFAADSEPPTKKPRRGLLSRETLKTPCVSEPLNNPCPKRRKLTHKQSLLTQKEIWEKIFKTLNETVPRVGKITIRDPEMLQYIAEVWSDKEPQFVIACRGTDRAIAPPQETQKGEAPFRRCAFVDRQTGKLLCEDNWEHWENLSQRQIIRGSHSCKLNITVFARNPSELPDEAHDPITENSVIPNKSTVDDVPQSQRAPDVSHSEEAIRIDGASIRHGPKFLALPKDEQAVLLRAHKNLGHPSPEKLMQLLRQQEFRPECVLAVPDMRCSACEMTSRPKISRPSTIKDPLDFNDKVAVDCIKWTNAQGTSFHILHVIDMGTSFHAACIAPSRTSSQAISNLISTWLQWAGAPQTLIFDSGTEFNSEEFLTFLQANGIKGISIAPGAHWQNGRSERHGQILENMLRRMDKESPIQTYEDLSKVLWFAIQAKNANSLRKGYAPEVLVFGKHTKIPGSLTSDEDLPAHCLADAETAQGVQFRKQLEIRERARKAFWEADNDSALRRAILRRSRPERSSYQTGEWVMAWKAQPIPGQWTGPMRVVTHENASTVWVTMAGRLYRVAPENLRNVSALEAHQNNLSKAITMEDTIRSLQASKQKGTTQFRDLSIPGDSNVPQQADSEIPVQNPPEHPVLPQETEQPSNPASDQPDMEPATEVSSETGELQTDGAVPTAENIPVPPDSDDDELICEEWVEHDDMEVTEEWLHQTIAFETEEPPQLLSNHCWTLEVTIDQRDIDNWKSEIDPTDHCYLATAAKRQRAEVKMSDLNNQDRRLFDKAKETEVQNWLNSDEDSS